MKKYYKILLLCVITIFGATVLTWAGTPTKRKYGVRFTDEGAHHDTPPSGYGEVYVNSDTLYFMDDSGNSYSMISGNGDNTLNDAYDQGGAGSGRIILATDGAVRITNVQPDTAFLMDINPNTYSSAALGGILVTSSSSCSEDSLQISNSGSGDDIQAGGGNFTVDSSGNLTCVNATISGSQYQAAIASAASGNTNLTIDASGTGTITFQATSTGLAAFTRQVNMNGDVNIGNAASDTLTITSIVDGNLTLDDGTTHSPSLILKDATDETATLIKTDGDNLTCTTTATEGLEIVTGNLWIGNGTPGTAAMDGEDFYCEGASEFDGTIQLDGAATFASTVALSGTTTATFGAAEYLQIDAATTDHTGTTGALDINFDSVTTGAEGVNVKVTMVAGGGGSEVVAGIVLDVDDDSDAGGTVVGLDIDSSDATGSSSVVGIRLGSTLEDQISSTIGAANQALVIDAATADNTNTSGVIDISYDTITNGCASTNIDMAVGDAGAGVTAHGILIDLDDDTSSNAANIYGFSATSSDLTGQANTVVAGFYTSGCDAAFQADNGYVRIGTGSSPDVTPSDDDLFVEGTVEVDGATRIDGALTCNSTAVITGNVDIGDAGTDTLTITSIIDGNVTLDDGVTASPSLIFKDATDETATFSKADSGVLSITTVAADGVKVLTGNLWVGDGSPGTAAMDGEDFYCEGVSEFDGAIQLDGAASFASTVALAGTTTATFSAAEYLQIDAATTDHTGTTGALDINFDSVTTGAEGVNVKVTFVAGGGGSEVVAGIVLDVDDDSDAAGSVIGLDIDSSDATGSSDVIGIRLGSTLEDQISSTIGAANQAIVIDAATADNTNTSGVIDIAYDTITNGCASTNIDMAVGDAGAGVTAHGILIDLDDDTSSNSANIYGFSATSSDLTGQANTVVAGFYTSGCDAAFQADNGYVWIGTGSTPGQTPSDDDLFVEGTTEIDGNLYTDGSIIGDGETELIGVKHDVVDGASTNPYTVTIAMSGTVFFNSEAIEFDLPEASTAIGCQYTFVVSHASNLDIDPEASDRLLGLCDSAGDMVRSATVGDTLTLICVDAVNWIIQSVSPLATDWPDQDA